MNLFGSKELFIGNRQNGERPYRKRFLYPQKMQAFFAFRSGLHHSRKFDSSGVILRWLVVAYYALLAQGDKWTQRLRPARASPTGWVAQRRPSRRIALYRASPHTADVKNSKLFLEPWDRGKSRGRFQRQRVILEFRFASKPSKFCVGERSERSKTETCDSRLRDMRQV